MITWCNGATRRGESGAHRHQGGRPLHSVARAGRRVVTVRLCALATAGGAADAFGASFDGIFADRIREADEFYADGHPRRSGAGCAKRDAAGVRRHAVVEAVLPLRRPRLAEGRSGGLRRLPPSASTAAITSGRTSTTPTSSRCRTSGSIRGTPRGTWRSTACRWRWSIPSSPSSSSCS